MFSKANGNGDEWSVSGAAVAGEGCGSNCIPCVLAEESAREKEEDKERKREEDGSDRGRTSTFRAFSAAFLFALPILLQLSCPTHVYPSPF